MDTAILHTEMQIQNKYIQYVGQGGQDIRYKTDKKIAGCANKVSTVEG